jgi:signal transduction histidine kinase
LSKKDSALEEKEGLTTAAARRDFLRSFLHDVATPLSAVSLHLEAADRRVRRGADPAESLAIARAEIARAFDLFERGRELLLFEPAEPESLPFDDLVTSAVSRAGSPLAKLRGKTGGIVRADRQAVAEALAAVLANAVEASSASEVTVSLARDRGFLKARVENPGRLPSGDPKAVFSPRVASAGKSWGLGLARARLLCAVSGGTVTVEQNGDRVAATVSLPEARA